MADSLIELLLSVDGRVSNQEDCRSPPSAPGGQPGHFQKLPRELLNHILSYIFDPHCHDRVRLDVAGLEDTRQGQKHLVKLAHLAASLYDVVTPLLYHSLILCGTADDSKRMLQSMRDNSASQAPRGQTLRELMTLPAPTRSSATRFDNTKTLHVTLTSERDLIFVLYQLKGLRSIRIDSHYLDWHDYSTILEALGTRKLRGLWLASPTVRNVQAVIRSLHVNWLVLEGWTDGAGLDDVKSRSSLKVAALEIRYATSGGAHLARYVMDHISRQNLKAISLYDDHKLFDDQQAGAIMDKLLAGSRAFKDIALEVILAGASRHLGNTNKTIPGCKLRLESDKPSLQLYSNLPDDLYSLEPGLNDVFAEDSAILRFMRDRTQVIPFKRLVLPAITGALAGRNVGQLQDLVLASRDRAVEVIFKSQKAQKVPFIVDFA